METEGRTGKVGLPYVLPALRLGSLFAFGSTQMETEAVPSTKNCMKAYVSEEEYAMITEKARMCGLSVSQFAKAVCLGFEVRSREDQYARVELRRVHADLGRLGGLLKMWLTNEDEHLVNVRRLLGELEARQAELRRVVARL